MPRVAVDILSGFLGSGKTTLLKHVLESGLEGHRVAVVVNEIGEIGIDGTEIRAAGIGRMVELSSGCVCCQLDLQFAAAVNEIIEAVRPDLIVLEASGLADPGNLVAEVESVGLMLDAVITVVDATAVLYHLEETRVAGRQIGAADYLVLNKVDLVGEAELSRVEKRLARLNDRAPIFRTERGKLPHALPFGTAASTWRKRIERSGANHIEQEGVSAFTWEGDLALSRRRFERVLAKLPKDVWRAKGIIRLEGASWPSLFSFAAGRAELRFLRLPPGPFHNRAVFIGRNLPRHRPRILAGLSRAEVPGLRADLGLDVVTEVDG